MLCDEEEAPEVNKLTPKPQNRVISTTTIYALLTQHKLALLYALRVSPDYHVFSSSSTSSLTPSMKSRLPNSLLRHTIPPRSLQPKVQYRFIHPTMDRRAKLEPAKRVAGRKQDVWYVVLAAFTMLPI